MLLTTFLMFGLMAPGPATPGTPPPGTQPTNDECSSRIPIGEGDTMYSTLGATGGGIVCTQIGQDIWFSFTPDRHANYTFSTCNAADYDTVIAVFSGTCDSQILRECNDDNPGCGLTSQTSSLPLAAGTEYFIQVGGFIGAQGNGTLTITKDAGIVSYCTTTPNSAGPGAIMGTTGSASIGSDDLVLTCSGLPVGEFYLFFVGTADANTPFVAPTGMVTGTRCVLDPCRLAYAAAVPRGGVAVRPVPVNEYAMHLCPTPVVGSQLYYQCYYRDVASGFGGNTSDAVAVVFGM